MAIERAIEFLEAEIENVNDKIDELNEQKQMIIEEIDDIKQYEVYRSGKLKRGMQ